MLPEIANFHWTWIASDCFYCENVWLWSTVEFLLVSKSYMHVILVMKRMREWERQTKYGINGNRKRSKLSWFLHGNNARQSTYRCCLACSEFSPLKESCDEATWGWQPEEIGLQICLVSSLLWRLLTPSVAQNNFEKHTDYQNQQTWPTCLN